MLLNLANMLIPLRSSRQRILTAALVVGAIAVACGLDFGSATQPTSSAGSGEPGQVNTAPSFTVETFNHGTYDLNSNVGRPVLINFWFPSCPPCRAELPDLQAAYEEFGDEIDFIGVQQTSIESAEEGAEFLAELGITYPNFADETESSASRVQLDYRILSFPTTVFLNRDHSISRTWTGLIGEEQLREQIENVIKS